MHLSRLTLDLAHPKVARAMGDLHELHRLILQGFPSADAGGPGRVLFRLERLNHPRDLPTVLVQSDKEPDWALVEAVTRAIDGPKVFVPTFAAGQVFQFRLRATPTKKVQFDSNSLKPGHRRVGFFTESDQRAWLERKGAERHAEAGGGFELMDVRITPLGWLEGKQPNGGKIRHHAVEFEGCLRVNDPEAFQKAVAGGVGPAKGFGFGLLSLARI
jgi:CRISPR system Cascade subunit CasE